MDEERAQSDNRWGERSSIKYIMDKVREQAILIDEEREQSAIMDEERDQA